MYKYIFLSLFLSPILTLQAQSPGELSWEYDVGSYIFSSPAISGQGNVYFGASNNTLYSISSNAELNWTFTAEDWIDSTPVIGNDGSLYFSSWDNYIYALNPDGSLKWKYLSDGMIFNSALISEETLYITGFDGYLYALDTQTAELKWIYDSNSEIDSSPILSNDKTSIYFADWDGCIYSINKNDGTERWTYTVDEISDRDYRITAAPATDSNGNIYLGSGNYRLYSLNQYGELNWYYETEGEIDNQIVIDSEDNVYFGSMDGYVYCLNNEAELQWKYETQLVEHSSCAIGSEGNIYAVGVINESTSTLYCLTPTGQLNWEYDFPRVCDASPVLTADNFLYLGIGDGKLYKIYTGESLANSHFPQFRQNPQRNSEAQEYHFTYPEWLSNQYGLETALSKNSIDDEDQDGLKLLTEYAIGTNPDQFDPKSYLFPYPQLSLFQLELSKNTRSLQVDIESSDNLLDWSEDGELSPNLYEDYKLYELTLNNDSNKYYRFVIKSLIEH